MKRIAEFARRHLIADATPISPAERWRSALAGLAGMLLFQAILFVLPVGADLRRLLAPLGATAVILFTLPHSPLAQPWSVAGGLILSAAIGIACGSVLPPGALACALAVAISMGVMAWLRCLHPPAGAMALVMSGAMAQGAAPWPSLAAVIFNVLAMLAAVTVVNNLVPGRRYPQCSPAGVADRKARDTPAGIGHADLEAALAEMDTYLDVSEEDLLAVFNRSAALSFSRHVTLTCADAMQPAEVAVEFATDLNEAWALLRRHRLPALPVVDRARRVIGLIGLEDFLHHVEPDQGQRLGENVRRLLRPTPGMHSDKPEVVGQIMREAGKELMVAKAGDSVAGVAGRLARGSQQAVPVIDAQQRLAGMITQADLVAVLFHHQALETTGAGPALAEPAPARA